jgi:hypothetical protein
MGARQIYEALREQILRGVYDTGSVEMLRERSTLRRRRFRTRG